MRFLSAPNPDAVVQELIAKGWVEKAPKKGREVKDRYQLTEAGRRLGEESAHLFKWPAAQSRIRPAPRYRDRLGCLMHLHTEVARLERGDPERELAPYQRALLRDLEGGLDEEALAAMHDYWNYNHPVIAKRGNLRRSGSYDVIPAPPRIEVSILFTSRGNLIVEWRPAGLGRDNKPTAECDWLIWEEQTNRRIEFTSRPSNELLFLHDVSDPTRPFPGMYDNKTSTPESVMVDAILLQATAAMLEELKERLKLSFEVLMVTDVFTEWEEVKNKAWPDGQAHVLARWRIENLEHRNKRRELAEIERFSEEFGCPLDVFIKALTEADPKNATGPAPQGHTKASRELKKAGYQKITIGVVERYAALLERHRPDLLPPSLAPGATADQSEGRVVPFKKPNGNGAAR